MQAADEQEMDEDIEKAFSDAGEGEGASPTQSQPIIWFAALFSVIWIFGASYLVYMMPTAKDCKGPLKCVPLNEWGDFVAGASAPLAFLWLVVAVFVQAKELAAQRSELHLTRIEFRRNRKLMALQADETRKQAKFIGTQTEILTRQAEIEEAALLEASLEDNLEELSAFVSQRLSNRSVIHGTRVNGQPGPAFFNLNGHDRDSWILALFRYFYGMRDQGLEAPYRVPPGSVSEIARVYDLCAHLENIAEALGSRAKNKLQRLRIYDIKAFLENNLSQVRPSADDDSLVSHGDLAFRLPRPPRQIDEHDADPQPAEPKR